jgi:putative hydrolase of the HAD superfamily
VSGEREVLGDVAAPGRLRALITDLGGVLTTPLFDAFAAVEEHLGVPVAALGRAMATATERHGINPLFELEVGQISEQEFLARLEDALEEGLGRRVTLDGFSDRWWAGMSPEPATQELVAAVRAAGYRTALLTNNVREWEPRWRTMLPVDELFDVVVDSAFVGLRKPDAAIYRLTCERLGVAPEACVFLDDLEANVNAARQLGMTAVHHREPEQSVRAVLAALADGRVS